MSTVPVKPRLSFARLGCLIGGLLLMPSMFTAGFLAHAYLPTIFPGPSPVPVPAPAVSLQEQLSGATGTLVDLRWMTIMPVQGGVRGLAWTPVGSDPKNAQEVTVQFGSSPQPIPPGPPSPPTDPLTASVQAAFSADPSTTKAADAAALAAVYRATAAQIVSGTTIKTNGDLFAVLQSASATRIAGHLATVRKALGTDLGKYLSTDSKAAMTQDQRATATAQLNRYADILGGLK